MRLRRLAADPLVHFLLLGVLVMALTEGLAPDPGSARQIHLSHDSVEAIAVGLGGEGAAPVSSQALREAVAQRIDEEVLYREALALGLDTGDLVVRRRLAQKMGTVLESLEEVRAPSPEALASWYEANADRYRTATRHSVTHLFVPARGAGDKEARDRIGAMLQTVQANPPGAQAIALGEPFPEGNVITGATARRLSLLFGQSAADQVRKAQAGRWSAPIRSIHGWHLFWPEPTAPGKVPALAAVQSRVLADYLAEARNLGRQRALEERRASYEIIVDWPAPSRIAATP